MDKEVGENLVKQLIECAVTAPSSMDCQPWRFVVVKGEGSKAKLAGLKGEENQQIILSAPILIVVCVDTEKSPGRWIEDGVTATQNLLLAAHDLGLGSVYVTGFKDSKPEVAEEIRDICGLPEHIMPVTILPVGHADPGEKLDEKSLLNVDEVVHWDMW